MRPFPSFLAAVLVASVALVPARSAHAGDAHVEQWLASERQSRSRPAVSACRDIESYAQRRANEMAAQRRVWHGQDLGSANQNWTMISEIVGAGASSPTITSAWAGSSSHRDKYLDARVSEVGVGTATDGDGNVYASVILRAPSSPFSGARPLGGQASAPPPPPPQSPSPAPAPPPPAAPAPGPSPSPAPPTPVRAQAAAAPTRVVPARPAPLRSTVRTGLWLTRRVNDAHPG